MKKLISFISMALSIVYVANADGGEDHGDTKKGATTNKGYFSLESVSDKYELLLKYQPIDPGKETTMRLFLSDFNTNAPIDNAEIRISSIDDSELKFTVTSSEPGIYVVKSTFPNKKSYALTVNINAKSGADLLELNRVEVGKQLPETVVGKENETGNSWTSNPIFLFSAGFILALLMVYFFRKLKMKKTISTFLLTLLFVGSANLPVQQLQAHGGEDHGAEASKAANYSSMVEVIKETQFLFEILTQKVETGDFSKRKKLFGTIIPSSAGQAILSSPQNGRIISLNSAVGQQVRKGQQLAIIEQNVDAASQVNLLAEKNNIDAEYEAAKKEYDRLKTIQDIASKKEFSETEARLQKATENKKLFNSSNGRTIILRSPIDGIVDYFAYSTGSTINANQTIFTITNLSKVYVEAQVFDTDIFKVNTAVKYNVEYNNDSRKTAEATLLGPALSINPTNQSQRVLFEMKNTDGAFKIGEFVNVNVFESNVQRLLSIPNTAISEINGKPVVFIKTTAELFSVNYVSLGENNGTHTVINKGVQEGDRIVINGTYQLKMIYLNN